MMMLCLSGCGGEMTEEDKLKDIEFTVVGEDQQPDSLKEIIAEKSAEPFQISYTLIEEQGKYYQLYTGNAIAT